MSKAIRLALLLVFVLLGSVGLVQAQDSLVETTFFMTYIPTVQFSQMYVGLEQGYFEEAGFNVTLEYGNEPDGVELIALGERQFGLISGEQVIVARANQRPIVSVYNWFQRFPVAVVVPESSDIEAVTDLVGRKVGVPGRFGATYSGLVALLASNGMSESDIELVEIGFNAPEVVCLGGVEASAVYANNEPLQIALRAQEGDCGNVTGVRVFPVADYVDLVSNGVVTSEQMATDHPDQVSAMVGAFDRSVRFVINNPAQAYLISTQHVENLFLTDSFKLALEAASATQEAFLAQNPTSDEVVQSRADMLTTLRESFTPAELLQFEILLQTITLWESEMLGISHPEAWESTQQTLVSMGFLNDTIDVTQAFSNDFLPNN